MVSRWPCSNVVRDSGRAVPSRSYQRMPISPVVEHFPRACRRPGRRWPGMSSSAATPLLNAVDDRELGGALLGLLQQMLRFVEQARVLERDAHRSTTTRLQQAHARLGEGVLASRSCRSQRAPQDAVADQDRHRDERLLHAASPVMCDEPISSIRPLHVRCCTTHGCRVLDHDSRHIRSSAVGSALGCALPLSVQIGKVDPMRSSGRRGGCRRSCDVEHLASLSPTRS